MALTDTSIRRPIATSMVFLIVITLGMIGFRYLPVDLLPPIEYPRLTVFVNYPNVGPQEIETIITEPIENALAGVPNVDEVTSESSEGRSRVTLSFSQGVNLDEAANDLRAALDRVRDNLPEEADAPGIWKFDPNDSPIVIIGAQSDMRLGDLTRVLERDITKRFEQIGGVGAVDVWGGIYEQIQVNIDRDRLFGTGLTASDLVQAIGAENVTLPGGNLRAGFNDLYVRSQGEFTDIEQIKNTVVTRVNGQPIRVRDVAEVRWGYEDVGRLILIDDKPVVRFFVRKQSGANTVEVAEAVRKEIVRINAERTDLNLLLMIDQSDFIQASIDNVRNSAVWGAVLAIIILFAFLRNGSTVFIIGIAIPISIVATFALLYFNGLTLNQMSFGGLALGVGMIVDNAIVVLENIVRLRSKNSNKREAASIGTKQVTGAIIASTITTCVIFLPVVFMESVTGLLFRELAIVVVFALVCSLFVALTIVPMASSRMLRVQTDDEKEETKWDRFFKAMEDRYEQSLKWSLHHKKYVYLSVLAAFGLSVYGWTTIPVELAPQTDADEVSVSINMAQGINLAIMREYAREMEAIVRQYVPEDDVKYLTTQLNESRAEVEIKLVDASKRKTNSFDLADKIRSKMEGQIPGAEVRVRAQTGLWILRRIFGSGGDEAMQIELRGYDLATADRLADEIKAELETVPGIADVNVSRREGRPEQTIRFDREKISELGLTVRQVAQLLQTNVGGSRASMLRKDGEEFAILVRLREGDRLSTLDLDNIAIRSAFGDLVPLSNLVKKDLGRGPTEINRVDGQRRVNINANLEVGTVLGEAVERARARLIQKPLPEGFSIVFGGEYEEQQKASRDFQLAIIIALVLVYMVMAAQFERFIDPLIVMFSVPIAIVGIVPIMILTNTTFNLQSLMGVIMLAGIVVNNAIVLVDYINLMRRENKMKTLDAIIMSGRLRLRPILMTTLTTVLGLVPLSFGVGTGGEIQASLARVVIGGLSASTIITLFLIPSIYLTVARAISWTRSKFGRVSEQDPSVSLATQ